MLVSISALLCIIEDTNMIGAEWGLGLHAKSLSLTQVETTLQVYLYPLTVRGRIKHANPT